MDTVITVIQAIIFTVGTLSILLTLWFALVLVPLTYIREWREHRAYDKLIEQQLEEIYEYTSRHSK